MVNGRGFYIITVSGIVDQNPTIPIEPQLFYEWSTAPAIPVSIDVDNSTGKAYVSDMGKG